MTSGPGRRRVRRPGAGWPPAPRAAALVVLLLLVVVALFACDGPADGLPAAAGRYQLKERSVSFDGERYSFLWADQGGALHRADTADVKLQLGEENSLEVPESGAAILHLKQEEPVQVEARDQQGDFGSFWYPFVIGQAVGGGPVVVNQPAPREYREPVYRYPPTDRIGRGETLTGSSTGPPTRPPAQDRLGPAAGSVEGQRGGTGGGDAATSRAQASRSVGGQGGGTGAGSAVLSKSGAFRTGEQGYNAKVDAGEIRPISGRTEPRVGAGSGASTAGLAGKPKIEGGRGSTSTRPTSPAGGTGGGTPRISTGRTR